MRRLACTLVILSYCSLLYAQELYRWQDEQGKWHFGDAASSNGKNSQVVEVAEETTNVVKMKKIKLADIKKNKEKSLKHSKKQKIAESLEQKKARCDKKRDELRFQAFRYDERNQYDHECVNEVKW